MGNEQHVRRCRCGTRLARDNRGPACAACQKAARSQRVQPPAVPPQFWQAEGIRAALATRDMGQVMRAFRQHPFHGRDVPQEVAAGWVGVSQSRLSRIENGEPVTDLAKLMRWAHQLGIPEDLRWFTGPGPQPDSGTLPRAESGDPVSPEHDSVLTAAWNHWGTVDVAVSLSGGGGRVKRRVFLALSGTALTAPAHQWLVHEPEALVSGLAGRRVSAQVVERLAAMVTELRQMDDVAGGGSVLGMAQHLFGWVARLLQRASYGERTGRGLHGLLAELGQLCGYAAFDVGEHGLAQRYYIAGLRAAHSASDRPFGAHILATMARQATVQGQPADAVTFVDTALAGTRGEATPALLAELYDRKAAAFAALGDTSSCTAAISQARAQAEQLAPDDDPPWLYWLDPAAITANAGTSFLKLGQGEQAVTLLDEGMAQINTSFVRDRQIGLARQAEARTLPGKQRDLEAAAGLGLQSLDLARDLDSTRGVGCLQDLYVRMKTHDTVPAVREFLERAKGLGGQK